MNGSGDELLAGAGFSTNEHRRVALRHLAHDVEHALQGAAGADDAAELVDIVLRVTEVVDLVTQAPELQRLFDFWT